MKKNLKILDTCVCGHKHTSHFYNENGEYVPEKGEFIRIIIKAVSTSKDLESEEAETVFKTYGDYGMENQVLLVACPKCGTIKVG